MQKPSKSYQCPPVVSEITCNTRQTHLLRILFQCVELCVSICVWMKNDISVSDVSEAPSCASVLVPTLGSLSSALESKCRYQ
jgi:hypothetical protein